MDKFDLTEISMRSIRSFQLRRSTVPFSVRFNQFRHSIFLLFQDPTSSRAAFYINVYFVILIIFSTIVFCLQTVYSLSSTPEIQRIWFIIETVIIAQFTFEYVIRLLTCPDVGRFISEFGNIVDLVSVIPYYIEIIFSSLGIVSNVTSTGIGGIAIIRVIRLVRIIRVFKISQKSRELNLLLEIIVNSGEGTFFLFFLVALSMVFFSSFLYFAEVSICDLQNGVWIYRSGPAAGEETPFQSIIHCFWWTLVTITTVGYGDQVPQSEFGKLIGSLTIVAGILVVTFSVTVLSVNVTEIYEARKRKEKADLEKEKEIRRLEDVDGFQHLSDESYDDIVYETVGDEVEDEYSDFTLVELVQKIDDCSKEIDSVMKNIIEGVENIKTLQTNLRLLVNATKKRKHQTQLQSE